MINNEFVHLSVHSHYSLLKALGNPKQIVKKAKDHGQKAIALTDLSYMYGTPEFYKTAKSENIKPILGVDFYFVEGSMHDKSSAPDQKPFRITVLAKNNDGYKNLMKLSTLAALEGLHYKPRIDFKTLVENKEGLIVLSGPKQSQLFQACLEENENKAIKIAEEFKKAFGEDFYIELQRHEKIPQYAKVEPMLLQIADELKIEYVATASSHYINSEDSDYHEILLCIGEQTNIHDSKREKYTDDFSIKSSEEMFELFSDLKKALENTVKIGDKCNVEINFGQYLIPKYKTPNGESASEYLKKLTYEGLHKLYSKEKKEKALKQLEYELSIVNKMGFEDYFLIVWDFIDFAKKKKIAVGPGRGSAAGSIIAYTLQITELEPLSYGLIFERFLNPARISMPDIDIDFSDHRRHEVLEYTIKKYGKNSVSQVITFGTMAAKAAVRDVGRAMGYPYSEVDKIAKAVPAPILGRHTPLAQSVEKDPELSAIYKNDQRAYELLNNAKKLEGTVRHAGTHACAVMICGEPLINHTPLQKATDGGDGIVTQYSMKPLEDIGLLKMDFLGLKNLTIIENTLKLIKSIRNIDIDILGIPVDDKKTFELFQSGRTIGVFQLESPGMRRYIKELKPTKFQDIVAMISLYRPGPMEWIPQYIKGKHFPETVTYADPSFEEILNETHGVAIYQEQIMQISQKFSGFTMAEADILRKAVGKKIPELLAEQRQKFIEGAQKLDHDGEHASVIFDKVILPFAGYGFNKAHAACYGMISYRTSYLKANYPAEFMASLMSADYDNLEKLAIEINDAEKSGLSILPPSINESFADFTVTNKKEIRFGLKAIKGVGEGVINEIIQERKKNGGYKNIEDFASRLSPKILNKRVIESLSYSGALDGFGERRLLAENYDKINAYSKHFFEDKIKNKQSGLFEETEDEFEKEKINFNSKSPLSIMEKLKLEKDYLGLYASDHPLKKIKNYLKRKVKLIESIDKKDIGKNLQIGGIIKKLKTIITKSGKAMAYGEIDDNTGVMPIVIFPKTYEILKFKISQNEIMFIKGKIVERRGEKQIIVDEIVSISIDAMINNAKEAGMYDNEKATKAVELDDETIFLTVMPGKNKEKTEKLKSFLKSIPGETRVFIKTFNDGKETIHQTKLKIDSNGKNLRKIENLLN